MLAKQVDLVRKLKFKFLILHPISDPTAPSLHLCNAIIRFRNVGV